MEVEEEIEDRNDAIATKQVNNKKKTKLRTEQIRKKNQNLIVQM